MPGPLGVRRVAEQQVDAAVAELREPADVGLQAVDGRVVELPVARVDDAAGRRSRATTATQSGIECAMRTNSSGNGAELDRLARARPRAARSRAASPCSSSFDLTRPERQARRDHLVAVDLAQQVRQRADVVLVAVREDDARDALVAQVAEVGQDEVDAEVLVAREREPGVDDDDLAAVLVDGHVLADLAEAAERDDPKRRSSTLSRMSARASRSNRGGLEQPETREAVADRSRSSSVASTSGSRWPPTSWPSRFSAALIAIGLPSDAEQLDRRARARGRARAPRRASPAFQSRTSSFTCGPTTCVCTQTPPTPPSSRNGRTGRRRPRRGRGPSSTIRRACSRSSFACLTARDVLDLGELGDRLRLDVDDDAARDVVDDDRPVGDGRDRLEVLDDPALRRLVVVRRHDQERVDAELVRLLASGAPSARSSTCRCRRRRSRGRRPRRARRCRARAAPRRRASGSRPSCRRRRGRRSRSRRGAARARGRRRRSTEPSRRNGVTIAVRTSPSILQFYSSVRRDALGGWSAWLDPHSALTSDAASIALRPQSSASSPTVSPGGSCAQPLEREQDARHERLARGRVVADRQRLPRAAEDHLLVRDEARAGARSGSASRPAAAPRSPSRSRTARRASCSWWSSTISACGSSFPASAAKRIISTAPSAKFGA